MKMQDNEFDELFRSKLNDFEAEPSAGVWPGIARGLAAGERKKALMPFLSIAATILVLVTAGILFIPQKTKPTVQNKTAKNTKPVSTIPVIKSSSGPDISKPKVSGKLNEQSVAVNRAPVSHPNKTTKDITDKNIAALNPTVKKEPIVTPVEVVKPDEQPQMIAATQKTQDGTKAVVPDKETPLTIKQSSDVAASLDTKPVIAATQSPAINKPDYAAVKPKHKIRSLGDFINVVVAKVDKRRDKIIEFSNTDDDESNITGVNLGIIKIKKGK
jgi:hypothetical protein